MQDPSSKSPNSSTGVAPEAERESRTPAGSDYGDAAPWPSSTRHDPSRGAELERDALPPDADFSHPPATGAGPVDASREARIRQAAYAKYERRGGEGSAEADWLEAEAELDREDPWP